MKHALFIILVLLCGCVQNEEVIQLQIPEEQKPVTTTQTTVTTSTTISLKELQERYWNTPSTTTTLNEWDVGISINIITTTSSTTTTTFKLKHQGKASDVKRITSTTTTWTLPPIREDYLYCVSDNDCGLAQTCCPCDFGGNPIPMNKIFIKQYQQTLNCALGVTCGWMKRPCNYRPVCVNQTCTKTLEDKEAT